MSIAAFRPTGVAGQKVCLWKQCDEVVLGLRVDPEQIRRAVDASCSLALDEGKARIAIMAQDCSQYWLDGEDLGPTQFVHVLVAVKGTHEVGPVVGAHQTLPSMTWFALFTGSTNARDRAKREAIRMCTGAIDGVSLDDPDAGSVTVRGGQRYSWRLPPAGGGVSVVGANHEVYSRDRAGALAFKRIQATARVVGAPVLGSLEAVDGVDPEGWVPPGTYDVRALKLLPVWARATLGEDLPGR